MSLYHFALYSCSFIKSCIIIKMPRNYDVQNLVEGEFCLFYFGKKLLSSFSSAGTVGIGTIVPGHLKGAFSSVSSRRHKSISRV